MRDLITNRFRDGLRFVYGNGTKSFTIMKSYNEVFNNKALSDDSMADMLNINTGVSVAPKVFFENYEECLEKLERNIDVTNQGEVDKLICGALVESATLTIGTMNYFDTAKAKE